MAAEKKSVFSAKHVLEYMKANTIISFDRYSNYREQTGKENILKGQVQRNSGGWISG